MEKIDRREFCKGAAGLAGIIAAGYGPSLYAAGANDKVRVACVGYSDRFRQTLLPCFLHHNKELNFPRSRRPSGMMSRRSGATSRSTRRRRGSGSTR